MIPLIVASRIQEKQEEFIKDFIREHAIRSYNIYIIKPIKTEVTIEQIRSIIREVITQVSEPRLFICYSFDNANLEAQNAFLKTLEEKHVQNRFILLASNVERILPTIRSRSKLMLLDSQNNLIAIRPETEAFFAELEKTKGYQFLSESVIQNLSREDAELFIDEFIIYLRNILRKGKKNASPIIKKTLELKRLLQNNNLNPQLTIDTLLIFFKKNIDIP